MRRTWISPFASSHLQVPENVQGFSSRGLDIKESCEFITKLTENHPMTINFIDVLDEYDPKKGGSDLGRVYSRTLRLGSSKSFYTVVAAKISFAPFRITHILISSLAETRPITKPLS